MREKCGWATSETFSNRLSKSFSNVTLLTGYNHRQRFGGLFVKINLAERTFPVLRRVIKA